MKKQRKQNQLQLLISIAAFALIGVIIFSMLAGIYRDAEKDGFSWIENKTNQIAYDLELQLLSDRENLITMASVASRLYSDGDDYSVIIDSFASIGLIDSIEILTSDGVLHTENGSYRLGYASYDELLYGAGRFTGRVGSISDPRREVVRDSVPIVADGETVGILIGNINPESIIKKCSVNLEQYEPRLFVIDSRDGRFVAETVHHDVENISELSERSYKTGFDYISMNEDIIGGRSGYTAFMPCEADEYYYAYYRPLKIDGWVMMLAVPERLVFLEADTLRHNLFTMVLPLLAVLGLYFASIYINERRFGQMLECASDVRRILIGLNDSEDGIFAALNAVREYAGSRSAWFVDTDGEDYVHVKPELEGRTLVGDDRALLLGKLFELSESNNRHDNVVGLGRLVVNGKLKAESPELYAVLRESGVRSVAFSSILNKFGNIGILAILNPRPNIYLLRFLRNISACFTISLYNRKYLVRTESLAVTDSLTGLNNRTAYINDVIGFVGEKPDVYACIYIDVNDLHYYNNRYGHDVGDSMLKTIADTLRSFFAGSHIYRMGGDEFLIFTERLDAAGIARNIEECKKSLEELGYHISTGCEYGDPSSEIDVLVKSAEKKMYEDKAAYYHKKKQAAYPMKMGLKMHHIVTGIPEVDACISIMSVRYSGVYCVELDSDRVKHIIAPECCAYLFDSENGFHDSFVRYTHEIVERDCRRAMLNFADYDGIKEQLAAGNIPHCEFVKEDGEHMVLRVYSVPGKEKEEGTFTVWVFEKDFTK